MKRRRPWHRWPRELEGCFREDGPFGAGFYDYRNVNFRRDMRMLSWRRP